MSLHPTQLAHTLADAPPVRGGTASMRAGSRTNIPYESALRRLLPAGERALLLMACLREGAAAAQAWEDFVARVGDVTAYFEADETGLETLLPFVEASLARNRIDAGRAFHTYARAAMVREAQRSMIYADIVEKTIGALEAAAAPV